MNCYLGYGGMRLKRSTAAIDAGSEQFFGTYSVGFMIIELPDKMLAITGSCSKVGFKRPLADDSRVRQLTICIEREALG
jgi:hypothetical protein